MNLDLKVDYAESSSMVADIYELQESTGFKSMDGTSLDVDALRNLYGADLVQLVGFYSGTCGIG